MGLRGGRWAIAGMVLCGGCSFDGSGIGTGAPTLEDDGGEAATTSGSGTTSGSNETTSGMVTTMSGPSTEPQPTTSPATTAAATTLPPRTTGPNDTEPDASDASTSLDTDGGETEDPVDCSSPRTYTLQASDAVLTAPMQFGSIQGVDMVFSTQEDAGHAAFTFDVECPSTYRVFARVRDETAGVNQNDPDSFDIELDGTIGEWFCGCDTVVDGFSWLVVRDGSDVETCGEAQVMTFTLSAGEHELGFGNREPQAGSAVAGIAEVVLTNDPAYTAPG